MAVNDNTPDAAQYTNATDACLCDCQSDWVVIGTQESCRACGVVRTDVLEVGVTWEEEIGMQGSVEEELCLEIDDKKIFCVLPFKAQGQCAHCLHLFRTKPPPVRKMLSEAHASTLMDWALHAPLATNVDHLANLVEACAFSPAQLVQSKDVNTETIRSMRKTMATAAALFSTRLKQIQSAHLVLHKNKSDLMYLKLGELSVALQYRAEVVKKAVTIGDLLQGGKYAAQVKKDLDTYLADNAPPKNTDPPPSHDSDIQSTLPERFVLELYNRDKNLFNQVVAFLKNDWSRKSQFLSVALAADKRKIMNEIFESLHGEPAGFCCNHGTCKEKTNVGLFLVSKKCSLKYSDLFRQFKLGAVLVEIANEVLPETSFREKVLVEAQGMFWASDFFENRLEGTLSTVENAIYGPEFSHVGCTFDASYMNRLCMYSAMQFFSIYMAPLFDLEKNNNDGFWKGCFDAFESQKATATADSIAIVKMLEANAIQLCASATFESDAAWLLEMAKYPTHNLDFLKKSFVEDKRRFLKEKAVVTKVTTTCTFRNLQRIILDVREFGAIVREGNSHANKRLIKNTYYSTDGVKWCYIFDRMPLIKGASAMRFLCDERERAYNLNVLVEGCQEDKGRRDALPTAKIGELTKMATQLEVSLALLVYGTRHSRATFIGFVGLSAASRRNIDNRYEHDVFAEAVGTHTTELDDLRNRSAMTSFLQRVIGFAELRIFALKAKKDQVSDDVHPGCVDVAQTPLEDEWVVEQSAKIRRLDDRIKCIQAFEAATLRFLRMYIDALDQLSRSDGDVIILLEASKFQAVRLVTNRKEIESNAIALRGTPTRPLSAALIPSINQGMGVLSIKAPAELERAFERALEISRTSSQSNCTEVATRITMQFLSPTMERLNNERRDAFLCGESQTGRTTEELDRLDMAGSFHRVFMSSSDDDRAIYLFRRVYKTMVTSIDNDAAAGYVKLITKALNSDDPVSSPVLRNSTVVRFLAEAAALWGSVRERRCATIILKNHYDFNKNEFVDMPNTPLVAYADDAPIFLTANEEEQRAPEIQPLFTSLESAEDAIRDRGRAADAFHRRYPRLKPVRFEEEAAVARRKKKADRDPNDVTVNSHMDDGDAEDHYVGFE